MLAFVLAAALPGVYWEKGPDSASTLKNAGISRVVVPAASVPAWKTAGFDAEPAGQREKVPPPGVQFRVSEASATRVPWIDANGWRYLRNPGGRYLCQAPAGRAALAAAEAFVYAVDTAVAAQPEDLANFGSLLGLLREIGPDSLPPLVNFGVVDDGSGVTGEAMNLLNRRNLLFRVLKAPDPKLRLNLRVAAAEAADPSAFAARIRQKIGDDHRLVRIFGSEVVIARLTGDGRRMRLHLLNYSPRPVDGVRVRLLGRQEGARLRALSGALTDYEFPAGATEFTVTGIRTYAAVDFTSR